MKTKISNKEITDGVANFLLYIAFVFLVNGLINSFMGNGDKWFSRWCLSSVLISFYGVIKAIQSLKE
mgnify:CR=1 FL=1